MRVEGRVRCPVISTGSLLVPIEYYDDVFVFCSFRGARYAGIISAYSIWVRFAFFLKSRCHEHDADCAIEADTKKRREKERREKERRERGKHDGTSE